MAAAVVDSEKRAPLSESKPDPGQATQDAGVTAPAKNEAAPARKRISRRPTHASEAQLPTKRWGI